MEDLYKRCAVLKGYPSSVDEHRVIESLTSVKNPATRSYLALQKYDDDDTVRWILRFRDESTAVSFIKGGRFTCQVDTGYVTVTPCYCPDCIIPQAWLEAEGRAQEDWSMVNPDDAEQPDSNEIFYSLAPETEDSSFHVVEKSSKLRAHHKPDYQSASGQRRIGQDNFGSRGYEDGEDETVEKSSKLSAHHKADNQIASGLPKFGQDPSCSRGYEDNDDDNVVHSGEMFGDGTQTSVKKTFDNYMQSACKSDSVRSEKLFGSGHETGELENGSPPLTHPRKQDNVESCEMFGSGGVTVKENKPISDQDMSKSLSFSASQLFGSGSGRSTSQNLMRSLEFQPCLTSEEKIDTVGEPHESEIPIDENIKAEKKLDLHVQKTKSKDDSQPPFNFNELQRPLAGANVQHTQVSHQPPNIMPGYPSDPMHYFNPRMPQFLPPHQHVPFLPAYPNQYQGQAPFPPIQPFHYGTMPANSAASHPGYQAPVFNAAPMRLPFQQMPFGQDLRDRPLCPPYLNQPMEPLPHARTLPDVQAGDAGDKDKRDLVGQPSHFARPPFPRSLSEDTGSGGTYTPLRHKSSEEHVYEALKSEESPLQPSPRGKVSQGLSPDKSKDVSSIYGTARPSKQGVEELGRAKTTGDDIADDYDKQIRTKDTTSTEDGADSLMSLNTKLKLMNIGEDAGKNAEHGDEGIEKNRKIKVTGLEKTITKEALELFFENKKRTGGGDILETILDLKKGQAIIEYRLREDFESVLAMQKKCGHFMCENKKLHVVEYLTPPVDPRKVFVTGIPKTSREGLDMYIEVVSQLELQDVQYGQTPGTAIFTFADVVDIPELRRGFERRSLEKCTMTVEEVEVTRSIQVTGLTLGSSTDTLELYFESQRSKGGEVERVEQHPDGRSYIVTFVNIQDAVNVCQKDDHTLNDQAFTVCLYYPCLDLDPDIMAALPLVIPEPLTVDMDAYMLRFLKEYPTYKQQFQQILSHLYGKVILPRDNSDRLTIVCSVCEDTVGGRDIVEAWQDKCHVAVQSVCENLTVSEKISVAREVWKNLLDRISTMNISNPEHVALFANKEDASVVVVGNNRLVDTLVSSIKEIVTELEEEMVLQKQTATKTKKFLSYQWALYHALRITDDLRRRSVKYSLEAEEKTLTVIGLPKDVDKCLSFIDKKIKSCPSQPVQGFNKMAIDLLFQTKARLHVKKELEKQRVIGVWDNRRGSLHVYSKTESDLVTAISITRSCIHQDSIGLTSATSRQMKSADGQNLLKRIEDSHTQQVAFDVKPSHIEFVSTSDISVEIKREIEEFLDLHSVVKETLSTDAGIMRYASTYKKNELQQIERQYGRLNVKIDMISEQLRHQFRVRGNKDGCKMTIRRLQDIVNNVHHVEHALKAPGVRKFLMSELGRRELESIEMSRKCVLVVPLDMSQVKTQTFQCSKACLGSTDVVVLMGDLLQVVVDAIVTPTTTDLRNSTGLGEAVVKAGGFGIQKECNDVVQKEGTNITYGEVVTTKAGSLACRHVLHAVIGRWKGGSQKEKESYVAAVHACFKKADKLKLKTLALPILGLGHFQYPLAKAAKWLLTETSKFLLDKKKSHCLETVYICDVNPVVNTTVVAELKNVASRTREMKIAVEVRGNQYDEESSSAQSDPEEEYEESSMKRVVGVTGGTIRVSVIVGELVKQKADIIVNSTNQNIDLRVGSLSKTLLAAGGEGLLQECLTRYPDGIKLGEVAETSGGDMACDYIFHGMFVHWDGGKGHAEQVMCRFINRCLELAHSHGCKCIAFPALGTGVLKFPADLVARMMFDCVRTYSEKNPTSSLKQVLLVVWQGDGATVKAFQAEEQRQKRKSATLPSTSSSTYSERSSRSSVLSENLYASLPDYSSSDMGPFKVEIVQGDITKEKTDCIVNSVLKEMVLSYGIVSKAILTAAGPGIQSECHIRENRERIVRDKLVVTSGGRMFCNKIIHLQARSHTAGWKESIMKCLEKAEFHGLKSLSFPALGTGAQGQKPEAMARVMMEAIREYGNTATYSNILRTIRIVIYQTDMLQKFINGSKSDTSSGFHLPSFPGLKKKKQEDRKMESINVHIYADSSYQADRVKRDLDAMYSTKETTVPLSLWEEISQLQKVKLQGMATNKGVAFKTDKKKPNMMITLQGFGKAPDEAMRNITAYLRNIERDLKKMEKKSEVGLPKTWPKMNMSDSPVAITLATTDKEHMVVATKFSAECPGVTIVRIQRIQNPALYVRFIAKKHEMDLANKRKDNERWLWHGTKPEVVTNINNKGFNRNYNSGSSHGSGVYLAVKAVTSAQGYCRPDAMGQKFIYLAQVLTGEYCVGGPGIRVPPQKPGGSALTTYDSTTDNVAAPNFFVIFHDDQAYPTYLITFK